MSKVKQEIQNNQENDFRNLYNKVCDLYDNQKYIDVINFYFNNIQNNEFQYKCFLYFNSIVNIAILTSICCCNIGNYQKAKSIMLEINQQYYIFKKLYCMTMKILKEEAFDIMPVDDAKNLVNFLNQTFKVFNQLTRLRFYNNLAYVHYKNQEYKAAEKFYKKALPYDRNNIQLIVGKNQAIYYSNQKHSINKSVDIIELNKDISIILNAEANFDSYLALGKLYYFKGQYESALNYIHIAINSLDKENTYKEIYAYDWISRIAYKQKQYVTASIFYEKIIDALVKSNNELFIDHEAIHPKPELHKMLKFLNETKQYIAEEETSKLNKSIWAGIIITSIFGLIDCYFNNHFSLKKCVCISLIIFIISCIIIRCNIHFFDFLKKYLPTYYKIFSFPFSKLK